MIWMMVTDTALRIGIATEPITLRVATKQALQTVTNSMGSIETSAFEGTFIADSILLKSPVPKR